MLPRPRFPEATLTTSDVPIVQAAHPTIGERTPIEGHRIDLAGNPADLAHLRDRSRRNNDDVVTSTVWIEKPHPCHSMRL